MTNLDIYFWRFFAAGAGFALMWRTYSWIAELGRAWRYRYTMPSQWRAMYQQIYEMMGTVRPHEPYPEWYRRFVAFRECAWLERPPGSSRFYRKLFARLHSA